MIETLLPALCTLTHTAKCAETSRGDITDEDLSLLAQVPSLGEVTLEATDLTPLLDCPWLTLLTLSPRHQSLAQEQLAEAAFQIQYQ